jgi:prepilin-type N-terminal cleavage/methylation domain-containing protein
MAASFGIHGRLFWLGMDGPWSRYAGMWRDERGFTLPELLTTIVILGILIAIAVILLLGILERRKVDAAANQLAADMRLAHTSATNQLTDWRVVLVPNRGEEGKPDYYLVKLVAPYTDEYPAKPTAARIIPRTFPANVKVMVQTKNMSSTGTTVPIQDNTSQTYYLSPEPSSAEATRTLEFNADGAMTGYGGSPSGTVRVTIDDDPQGRVRYLAATSRIKVLP